MKRTPELRDLVGDEVSPEERARLERVHELLVAAGPPAELPAGLKEPRATRSEQVSQLLPRRRVGAALALAAAIALVAFLGGYVVGFRHNKPAKTSFHTAWTVRLHGTARLRNAAAVVQVGPKDGNGNVPMLVTVRGLKKLGHGGYYTLALTKHGRPVVSCGTFRVRSASGLTVPMTVAYDVKAFDGWVVTEYRHGSQSEPIVLTS